MSYLRLRRAQWILVSFIGSSLFLVAFSGIDLRVSAFFYDGTFAADGQWWQQLLHEGMGWFLAALMLTALGLCLYNKCWRRNCCGVNGRKVIFLFLVLFLGAGLIVNLALKDNFGRARPRDIAEFGGSKQFTAAFIPSNECRKNCSFSSGEGAAGFFALVFTMALTRRRALVAAAFALGVLVSFSRIAAGAHFFSDTVVSFFVMLIVADVLYFYVLMTEAERAGLANPTRPAVNTGVASNTAPP
jgi:lipid A 4'-phosphatase